LQLKTSAEDATRLILSIPHQTCAKAFKDHWKVDAKGVIRAQSTFWLSCWTKTGMNSEDARIVAVRVFDQVMPMSFAQFDSVVDHKYARECRYVTRDLERELQEKLADSIPRSLTA
jgi:hypothetical protein